MAASGLGASNTQILSLKLNHKTNLPCLPHGIQVGSRPKAWKHAGFRVSLRSNKALIVCQSQSSLITESLRVSSGEDVQHLPKNRTSVLAHHCRWLPQEICTCQRISRCAGVTIESSTTTSQSGNIVGKYFLDSKKVSISCRSLRKYSLPVRALLTSKTSDVSTRPIVGEEKIGVLLLNLGGPETLEDVQPFLYNLFADPDIIRLPRLFRFLQKPLAQFISIARSPKSKEGYASIGGGSPLRQITDEQAEELRKALSEKDVPAKVYVGMRYWHPFTEEAIEEGGSLVIPLLHHRNAGYK